MHAHKKHGRIGGGEGARERGVVTPPPSLFRLSVQSETEAVVFKVTIRNCTLSVGKPRRGYKFPGGTIASGGLLNPIKPGPTSAVTSANSH